MGSNHLEVPIKSFLSRKGNPVYKLLREPEIRRVKCNY